MNRRTAEAVQERIVEELVPAQELAQKEAPIPVALPTPWRVTGAAVQGVSHARLGLPCQDAQGYRVLPDGTLIIALADGAGSARFSDQGAQRAVQETLNRAAQALENGQPEEESAWNSLLLDVFGAAREAVLQLAQGDEASVEEASEDEVFADEISEDETSASESGEAVLARLEEADDVPSARDFACTLTCVLVTADRLVVGQIGDGAVIAGNDPADLFAATRLQRGEYANETHFLTQVDALDQVVIENVAGRVSLLAVMSDGLIRLALKLPTQEPHLPFFQPLFRFAQTINMDEEAAAQARENLAGFLNSERVNARTDDDKSLVLAVRAALEAEQQG